MSDAKFAAGKKRQNIEDYYKILGTTARAGQDKIKERYIEKIREFPPETHPDEFQIIRKAYETLKNPGKRKEYDVLRKFGPKIEKEMNKAMVHMMLGEAEEAHQILDKIIKMDPNNSQVYLIKAELYLTEDQMENFIKYYDKAAELVPREQLVDLSFLKIRILTEHDYLEEALIELKHSKEEFTDKTTHYDELSINIYKFLNDFENLWRVTTELAPSIKESTSEDIYLFIDWLIAGVELEKKNENGHIVSRIKKVIKLIDEEDELEYLLGIFMKEYFSYYQVARFSDAGPFLDLALVIDKSDPELQQEKKHLAPLAALDFGIRRLDKDYHIIPYVRILALKLFYEKHTGAFEEDLREDYYQLKSEFEGYDEEIAISIQLVKKKYNAVYKAFQNEWEELFSRHTADLNREAKRRLR